MRAIEKTPQIAVKRIYEAYSENDGYRMLVDRLWPRGIRKEQARIDEWQKEIAPSTALRQSFNHDPDHWISFQQKYRDELKRNPALSHMLAALRQHPKVTLLYAARDEQHNQALILRDFLVKALRK